MRVIAGSLRGRRLRSPSWPGLRPTGDKLRGAVFNILALRIPGARVLDGYAGTGAAGIEALSRGAAEVVFVERDRRAVALIEENLTRCGLTDGCVIIRGSLLRAVERLHGMDPFDVILLDPPYAERPDAVLADVGNLLTREGILTLEHARRRVVAAAAGRLVRIREIVAGSSAVSFYACQP